MTHTHTHLAFHYSLYSLASSKVEKAACVRCSEEERQGIWVAGTLGPGSGVARRGVGEGDSRSESGASRGDKPRRVLCPPGSSVQSELSTPTFPSLHCRDLVGVSVPPWTDSSQRMGRCPFLSAFQHPVWYLAHRCSVTTHRGRKLDQGREAVSSHAITPTSPW